MIDEHQSLNRSLNIKRKKFSFDEFMGFTAYQIYTLLSLNKEAIVILERKIFPKNLAFLTMVK